MAGNDDEDDEDDEFDSDEDDVTMKVCMYTAVHCLFKAIVFDHDLY